MKPYGIVSKNLYKIPNVTFLSSLKTLNIRCLSSATPQVKESQDEQKELKKTCKEPRVRALKKFSDPFPKCLLVGKCPPEVLEYPEVLNNEEIDILQNNLDVVQSTVKENVNPTEIDKTGIIPKTLLNKLKDLNLFGINVSHAYGGLNSTATELQLYEEILSYDASVWKLLHEHNLAVVPIFELFANANQKSEFLPKLCSGEILMTSAYLEALGASQDPKTPITMALKTEDGYEITGSKQCVFQPLLADYFLTVASTTEIKSDKSRDVGMTLFLVDRNEPGVVVKNSNKFMGARGINIGAVDFNKVRVSNDQIIGELNKGLEIIEKVTLSEKLSSGSYAVGVLKNLINTLTQHLIHEKIMGKPVAEIDSVRYILGKITAAMYSIESSVYLMAGIKDLHDKPDLSMDSCIIKVLASERLQSSLQDGLQLIGPFASTNEKFSDLNRIIRDAQFYAVFDDSNTHLKVTISLLGLQYAGTQIHKSVRRYRNPFMFPKFIFSQILKLNRHYGDNPKINLGFPGFLHPSLEDSAKLIEYCIARLDYATQILLVRYGKDIINEQMELLKLADIIISIYSAIAALGRSSRSYCIGLRNAEYEIGTAIVIARQCHRDVKLWVDEIQDGPFVTDLNQLKKLADSVFFNKAYSIEHPIARNF